MEKNKHTYIDLKYDNSARLIFSSPSDDKKDYSFKNVLDDFNKASVVRIASFNISEKYFDYLLKHIYNLPENVKLKIVVGLPGSYDLNRATKKATSYLNVLNKKNFKSDVDVSINVKNHAKIISTENICYIGSQNFSYGSTNNHEAGIILRDKKIITDVFQEFDKIFDSGVKYELPNSYLLINYIQLISDIKSDLYYFDEELEEDIIYLNSEDLLDMNMKLIEKQEKLKKDTKSFLSVVDSYKLPNWNKNDKKEFENLVNTISIKELIELPDDEYINPDEDFGIQTYASDFALQKLRDNEIEDLRMSDYIYDLKSSDNKKAINKINDIESKVSSIVSSANDYIDSILVDKIVGE